MQNQICCRNVCRQGRERYVHSSRDKRLTSARNIQTRHRRTVNTFTISFPSNVLSPDVCTAYFRLDRATRVRHQRKREPPHRHKSIRWKKTSSLSLSRSPFFTRNPIPSSLSACLKIALANSISHKASLRTTSD